MNNTSLRNKGGVIKVLTSYYKNKTI